MIKHIVIWKLDPSYTAEEKVEIMETMKEKLMGLDGKIDALKTINVQFNHSDAPEANYDVCLYTEFKSIDDLTNYQVHPEHQKVVGYIKPLKTQRAAVDYEF